MNTKIQVGDWVQCVYNDTGSDRYVGTVAKVVRMQVATKWRYSLEGIAGQWFSDDELMLHRKGK